VLTGFDDRSSGEKALALGAQDYLTKGSVNDESLARALRYAITRRRSEEDARRLREAELLRAENSRLERGLLPSPLILNPSLSWATRYRPGGLRALLGGDFFDAVELGDGTIRVVIGDVAGHGPDEAALGVALRVAWRALVLAGQPADSALRALERVLEAERNDDGMFVTFATLCDIEIEPGLERAKIYLAGHPAPFLFDGENVFEAAVSRRRPPLGAVKTAGACTPNVVELGSEWTMVAFTDGIFEGRTGQGTDRLDTEGLIRLTEGAFQRGTTLREVASLLVAAAEEANGEPLADDVALVVLSTAARWRN
jgi:serine phosphatase RsbU (regulator of sigma subunit)